MEWISKPIRKTTFYTIITTGHEIIDGCVAFDIEERGNQVYGLSREFQIQNNQIQMKGLTFSGRDKDLKNNYRGQIPTEVSNKYWMSNHKGVDIDQMQFSPKKLSTIKTIDEILEDYVLNLIENEKLEKKSDKLTNICFAKMPYEFRLFVKRNINITCKETKSKTNTRKIFLPDTQMLYNGMRK